MDKKDIKAGDFTRTSLLNFTFRVKDADPGDFIALDESKCNGCGDCSLVCSVSLWAVKDKARLSEKYKDLCLECAACYEVCEPGAIDFSYPKGGSGIIIKHG